MIRQRLKRYRARLRALPGAKAGIAVTETALVLPFFLGAGLCGIELANYSLTSLKIGQVAVQVADNASRIGDISSLTNRKIYESDINDLLLGASIQAGSSMGLYEHGRVIVSSLEVNADKAQYIHWQRCLGKLKVTSSYGLSGDILNPGMGPKGREVMALEGEAVIFVEIRYTYQPLISDALIGEPTIATVSSFTVRSSRDLSQIYRLDGTSSTSVARCDSYTATISS